MKWLNRSSIAALLLSLPLSGAQAGNGNGTTAGLTLLESPSARAFSLGESLVAGSNDIAALGYNPASLSSMKTGQASFLYQKGLVDDSYGHFMIGAPSRHGGIGLSVGYYNGGTFDMTNTGGATHSVTAQRDLALALSSARQFGPVSLGVSGKYLSSEIAEAARATAFAADFGLSVAASSVLRLGASLQNVGTALKYADHGDELPRMARLGGALSFRPGGFSTSILFDGTYRMVEKEFEPAAGLEVGFGVLALRVGYRGGSQKALTAGTGFMAGRASFDYAFGVTSGDLSASHRISYSLRFGGPSSIQSQLVSAANARSASVTPVKNPPAQASASASRPIAVYSLSDSRKTVEVLPSTVVRRVPRTYEIKDGDSLASIAQEQYGDPRLWRSIYQANAHLIEDPTRVKTGQKIVLP